MTIPTPLRRGSKILITSSLLYTLVAQTPRSVESLAAASAYVLLRSDWHIHIFAQNATPWKGVAVR